MEYCDGGCRVRVGAEDDNRTRGYSIGLTAGTMLQPTFKGPALVNKEFLGSFSPG